MADATDVAIIGAGPCGLAAGASLKKQGLTAILFDKGCITNSIVDYPPYMTFFSTARNLELEDNVFAIFRNNENGIVASLHSTMTQWRHLFSLEIFLEGVLFVGGGFLFAFTAALLL